MKTEEHIKQLFHSNSTTAFEELFKLYHAQLCRYIFSVIQDVDESKEIAQNCFIQLWEKRESIETIKSLKLYLFRSAHNMCLNRFKHEKVKSRYITEERYYLQSILYSDFESTHNPELSNKISEAVEGLPKKNKEVFKLRYYKGLNTVEVSKELDITPRTVETHISKAFKILREELAGLMAIIVIFLIV